MNEKTKASEAAKADEAKTEAKAAAPAKPKRDPKFQTTLYRGNVARAFQGDAIDEALKDGWFETPPEAEKAAADEAAKAAAKA